MKYEDKHFSDQELLLYVDGEHSAHDRQRISAHLEACWKCRARSHELENAMADYVQVHETEFDQDLPPIAGPRALLKARIDEFSAVRSRGWFGGININHFFGWALAAGACAIALFSFPAARFGRHGGSHALVLSVPNSALTPGATLLMSRPAVCAERVANNKAVPAALQRKVFEEYGLDGADPRGYEIDYLVTPALGGADDIHNLWPHSYSTTVWNARVKDALEVRMHDMVCDGTLDLTEAQQEIAEDWISAYKKYFRTNSPLP
jgi:hypothetical protein